MRTSTFELDTNRWRRRPVARTRLFSRYAPGLTASAAVLIGESGPDIEARLRQAGLPRTTRARTLEEAVVAADAYAHLALGDAPEGAVATVLLSPAAASFDMFEDYAARGRAFKDEVRRLAAERARG